MAAIVPLFLALTIAGVANAEAATPAPPQARTVNGVIERPADQPAIVPMSSLPKRGGGLVQILGGYGWQRVVAQNVSIRTQPGGSVITYAFYGDYFNTTSISGSWCYGHDYFPSGNNLVYWASGWVLCQYLHKI